MWLIDHFKGKGRRFKGALIFTCLLVSMGCQRYLLPARIDLAQMPQKVYRVMVYEGIMGDPAVVFDLVEDDLDIELYSHRAREEGLRPPAEYVKWIRKTGYFSVYGVKDRDGEVRGYLLISRDLRFTILHRKKVEMIRIEIDDPWEVDKGPRLGPWLKWEGPEEVK